MKQTEQRIVKELIIIASLLVVGSLAFAAEGGHGGAHGEAAIPFKTIMYQLINVAVLFGGLFYLTKDKVAHFFANRQAQYQDAYKKTKTAREEAEKNLEDVKSKLNELQKNKGESLLRAQQESEKEKIQLIKEAQEKAKRIKADALNTLEVELSSAKNSVRTQLIDASMKQAKALLQKDIGSQDHQKLQVSFSASVEEIKNENARSL